MSHEAPAPHRLTPACAGRTTGHVQRVRLSAADPRLRGEDSGGFDVVHKCPG